MENSVSVTEHVTKEKEKAKGEGKGKGKKNKQKEKKNFASMEFIPMQLVIKFVLPKFEV